MAATADESELPAQQAELLQRLLTAGTPTTESNGQAAAPDRFSYELTVDDGQRSQTFHWAETQLPEEVRPLIDGLASRARPVPPA